MVRTSKCKRTPQPAGRVIPRKNATAPGWYEAAAGLRNIVHMNRLIRLALAIDLTLVVIENLWHPAALPIGGGPLAQIAVVLIAAIILTEVIDVMGPPL